MATRELGQLSHWQLRRSLKGIQRVHVLPIGRDGLMLRFEVSGLFVAPLFNWKIVTLGIHCGSTVRKGLTGRLQRLPFTDRERYDYEIATCPLGNQSYILRNGCRTNIDRITVLTVPSLPDAPFIFDNASFSLVLSQGL